MTNIDFNIDANYVGEAAVRRFRNDLDGIRRSLTTIRQGQGILRQLTTGLRGAAAASRDLARSETEASRSAVARARASEAAARALARQQTSEQALINLERTRVGQAAQIAAARERQAAAEARIAALSRGQTVNGRQAARGPSARDANRARSIQRSERARLRTTRRINGRLRGQSILFAGIQGTILRTLVSVGALAAVFGSIAVTLGTISAGVSFADTLERSGAQIAGLVVSTGRLVDENGVLVDTADGYAASLGLARGQVDALRQDALRTAATFDELLQALQVSIGPGLSAGLNLDEIRELTVQISQAATALGIEQNQLAEEIRSLFSGTINPRTSRIATALGISNEDVRNARDAGTQAEFLRDRLQGIVAASEDLQGSLQVTFSNVQDIFLQVAGAAFEPFRQSLVGLGVSLQNLFGSDRFASAIRTIGQGLASGADSAIRFVDGLDGDRLQSAANALVTIGSALGTVGSTLASVPGLASEFAGDVARVGGELRDSAAVAVAAAGAFFRGDSVGGAISGELTDQANQDAFDDRIEAFAELEERIATALASIQATTRDLDFGTTAGDINQVADTTGLDDFGARLETAVEAAQREAEAFERTLLSGLDATIQSVIAESVVPGTEQLDTALRASQAQLQQTRDELSETLGSGALSFSLGASDDPRSTEINALSNRQRLSEEITQLEQAIRQAQSGLAAAGEELGSTTAQVILEPLTDARDRAAELFSRFGQNLPTTIRLADGGDRFGNAEALDNEANLLALLTERARLLAQIAFSTAQIEEASGQAAAAEQEIFLERIRRAQSAERQRAEGSTTADSIQVAEARAGGASSQALATLRARIELQRVSVELERERELLEQRLQGSTGAVQIAGQQLLGQVQQRQQLTLQLLGLNLQNAEQAEREAAAVRQKREDEEALEALRSQNFFAGVGGGLEEQSLGAGDIGRDLTVGSINELRRSASLAIADAFDPNSNASLSDRLRELAGNLGNRLAAALAEAFIVQPFIDLLQGSGGLFGGLFGGAIAGLATGGPVGGPNLRTSPPGTAASDRVLTALTPGEFVLRKKAAQRLGPEVLNALNTDFNRLAPFLRQRRVPGFAAGGGVEVASRSRGSLGSRRRSSFGTGGGGSQMILVADRERVAPLMRNVAFQEALVANRDTIRANDRS